MNINTAVNSKSKTKGWAHKCAATFVPFAVAAIIILLAAMPVHAGNFIGDGQPAPPGWAVQLWPSYARQESNYSASNFFQLAWFSDNGVLSDEHKDQVELWGGFFAGYQESDFESEDSRWGTSSPQVGVEYYYQAFSSNAEPNTDGYRAWWVSPMLWVNMPNGSEKSTGFGAGANQYSVSFSVNNFFGYDKWQLSVNPVAFTYMYRNRHSTELEDGSSERLQGGLSLYTADITLGYQVADTLAVGVHHEYDFYNVAASDFDRAERGMIGPSVTYSGLASKNIWIAATVDFDYTNRNTERSTTFSAFIGYSF
jgi:hypothetical protein